MNLQLMLAISHRKKGTPSNPLTGYFISDTGDDDNNGTSESTPWLSLTKLNAEIAAENIADNSDIYFKKGGVYEGSLVIADRTLTTGLRFDAYGTGTAPKISGNKTLTGTWEVESGNVWKLTDITLPENRIRSLEIASVRQDISRWPAAGTYRHVGEDSPSKGYFDDASDLGLGDNYFVGGSIVVRNSLFTIDNSVITSHSGTRVNFSPNIEYAAAAVCKYYIVNSLGCLLQNGVQGNWAYNPTTQTVYLYSTTDPNTLEVSVSIINDTVSLTNSNNISISNININASNNRSILISNCDNVVLDTINITNSGYNGIHLLNSDGLTGSGIVIDDVGNKGLLIEASSDYTIDGIEISNVGARRELGEKGGATTTGISFLSGDNGHVTHAYIHGVAYNGISVINPTTTNLLFDYSYVTNCGLTKTDGAGIYTWGDTPGTQANNVVDHVLCDDMLHDSGIEMAEDFAGVFVDFDCFYSDDESSYITYSNCVGHGGFRTMYFHSTHNMVCNNNLFYGGEFDVLTIEDARYNEEMFNHNIHDNIFMGKSTTSRVVYFGYLGNWATGTHTGDNAASVLTPSVGIYAASQLVTLVRSGRAMRVRNVTDGSTGDITANTTTTVTATLTGGTNNYWNTGDTYVIEGELDSGTIVLADNYFLQPYAANDLGGNYPQPAILNSYQCTPPLSRANMNYNDFIALSYVTGTHGDPVKYATSGVTDPGFIYFDMNPSTTVKNVNLAPLLTGGEYFVDVDGTTVGTSINIPAYSGIVLYKRT